MLTTLKRRDCIVINGKEYKKLDIINTVNNSESKTICGVFKCEQVETGKIVFIKIQTIDRPHFGEIDHHDKYKALNNYQILGYEVIHHQDEIIIISDDRGESMSIIRDKLSSDSIPITISMVLQIMIQYLVLLKRFHSMNLVHRDVKMDNILLNVNWEESIIDVVMADFGIVKDLTMKDGKLMDINIILENSIDNRTTISTGTYGYIAPEAYSEYGYVCCESDYWSFGITMLAFIFNLDRNILDQIQKHPNNAIDIVEKLFNDNDKMMKLEKDDSSWNDISNILKIMLNMNPENRRNVLDHILILVQDDILISIDKYYDYLSMDSWKHNKSVQLLVAALDGEKLEILPSKNDKDIVLKAVDNEQGYAIQYACDEFRNDKELILVAVKRDIHNFQYASDSLKSDRDFVKKMIEISGYALKHVSEELKCDREIVLLAINNEIASIDYIPSNLLEDIVYNVSQSEELGFNTSKREEILNHVLSMKNSLAVKLSKDRNIMTMAVKQNGMNLEYASNELRNDRDILKYASIELRNDREIVLAAVSKNGLSLEYASDNLRNDRNIVIAAVSNNGLSLEYASDNLKSNKEIVLMAVINNANSLEFTSYELINDRDFAAILIIENIDSLEFINDEFKNDPIFYSNFVKNYKTKLKLVIEFTEEEENLLHIKQFAISIVIQNPLFYFLLPKDLQRDKDLILELLKSNGKILCFLPFEIRNDRDIVMNAVKVDGHAIRYASKELLNDREIVMAAIEEHPGALEYVSEEMKNDREIILKAIINDYDFIALKYASEDLRNDRDIVMKAITQNCKSLKFASIQLRNDREFILQTTNYFKNGKSLKYLSDELRNDKEIVLEAVTENCNTLKYASDELRNDRDFILTIIENNCYAIKTIQEKFRTDKEIIMLAIGQDEELYEFIPNEFKQDREFILESIKNNSNTFKQLPLELQQDREFILECIKKNSRIYANLSLELQQDREFILECIKKNSLVYKQLSLELQQDRNLIFDSMLLNRTMMKHLPEDIRKDREFIQLMITMKGLIIEHSYFNSDREMVLLAVSQNGFSLKFVKDDELKNDFDIVFRAITQNGLALQFASEELKKNEEICIQAVLNNRNAIEFVSESIKEQIELKLLTEYYEYFNN